MVVMTITHVKQQEGRRSTEAEMWLVLEENQQHI